MEDVTRLSASYTQGGGHISPEKTQVKVETAQRIGATKSPEQEDAGEDKTAESQCYHRIKKQTWNASGRVCMVALFVRLHAWQTCNRIPKLSLKHSFRLTILLFNKSFEKKQNKKTYSLRYSLCNTSRTGNGIANKFLWYKLYTKNGVLSNISTIFDILW